jgi:hypothetical protein
MKCGLWTVNRELVAQRFVVDDCTGRRATRKHGTTPRRPSAEALVAPPLTAQPLPSPSASNSLAPRSLASRTLQTPCSFDLTFTVSPSPVTHHHSCAQGSSHSPDPLLACFKSLHLVSLSDATIPSHPFNKAIRNRAHLTTTASPDLHDV